MHVCGCACVGERVRPITATAHTHFCALATLATSVTQPIFIHSYIHAYIQTQTHTLPFMHIWWHFPPAAETPIFSTVPVFLPYADTRSDSTSAPIHMQQHFAVRLFIINKFDVLTARAAILWVHRHSLKSTYKHTHIKGFSFGGVGFVFGMHIFKKNFRKIIKCTIFALTPNINHTHGCSVRSAFRT